MAANSLSRRLIKRLLGPVLTERNYRLLLGLAKSWDIRTGSWAEPTLELIDPAVRAGEIAIDIGANFGLYSYHLDRAVGPAGRVYAFEPLPFTSETFKVVARLLRFKRVELIPKGCGEVAGPVQFTVPVQRNGAFSTGLAHMARDDARPGRAWYFQHDEMKQIECPVVAVDDYLPELRNVSFLKCDIEGADYFAMKGAARTIERNHPTVVCEIDPWFMQGFGLAVSQLVDLFASWGYEVFGYEGGRLRRVTVDQINENNWVFVHPERRDRVAHLIA
jgi:FkbM family methyltransferase